MSLKVEGSSCVRCKAYLFSEDDVVYCPECGAPHHRECYNALGHCALEELHGTENEYSREKVSEAQEQAQKKAEENKTEQTESIGTTECNVCGEKYSMESQRCPKCGAPNIVKITGYNGFDFLGGVPADYKLDENVTAEDAKKFVASNTHRYIPKFATLNEKKRVSWNWMAFLFPCGWMFSRKMYKNGILLGILCLMVSLLAIPLTVEMRGISIAENTTYLEAVMSMAEAIPQMSTAAVLLQLLGRTADLIIRTVSALFGDYIYRTHTVSAVKRIKAESEDIAFDYRKYGGVSLFGFLLATMVLQYLPSILVSLF